MDIGYAMNYQYLNEIDMNPGGDSQSWGWFGPGISSITKDKSETTEEEYFYDGFGQAENAVSGLSQSLTVEGKRRMDDPCQNWVASHEDDTGDDLLTTLRQTDPTGKVIERDVTVHEIKAGQDGAANEKAKFSCKISFNGQPRLVQESVGSALPETVTAESVTVAVGENATITPTVTPTDANDRCVFASGNHKIASVTPDGVVTGIKAGKTRITIKCVSKPSVAKQVDVTVTAATQQVSQQSAKSTKSSGVSESN